MADFSELITFRNTSGWVDLRNKVMLAAIIKAQAIAESVTPTSELKTWARGCLQDPFATADTLVNYVIADNASATIAQITAASDNTIQTAVNNAVDKLFGIA